MGSEVELTRSFLATGDVEGGRKANGVLFVYVSGRTSSSMFLENYFFRGHYVSRGSYLIVDISVYMRRCTWQFHRSYFDFLQQP